MHPQTLDNAQVATFRAASDTLRHPYSIAFDLMLEAGLRVSEVTKLTWGDLVHLGAVKTALQVTAPVAKSHRARTIPITLRLSLSVAKAWRREIHVAFPSPADFVVAVTFNGKAVTARSIQRNLQTLCRATLGIDVNPHMLRHTFATRLLRVTNLIVVQAALGHARVSTTQIYTHTSVDDLADAMAKVH